jgi:protein involved in polysaccharide export with SLBB domain
VASGSTLGDAATEIGIGYRTARRWKKRPEVAAAIKDRASEQVALGRAVLAAGMGRAARALVDMSDGKTKAEAARVSAAKAVVESTTKLVEVEEMRAEMEAIKQQLASLPGRANRRSQS